MVMKSRHGMGWDGLSSSMIVPSFVQLAALEKNATCISELESLRVMQEERCGTWTDIVRLVVLLLVLLH